MTTPKLCPPMRWSRPNCINQSDDPTQISVSQSDDLSKLCQPIRCSRPKLCQPIRWSRLNGVSQSDGPAQIVSANHMSPNICEPIAVLSFRLWPVTLATSSPSTPGAGVPSSCPALRSVGLAKYAIVSVISYEAWIGHILHWCVWQEEDGLD